jgi:hypothetical protein
MDSASSYLEGVSYGMRPAIGNGQIKATEHSELSLQGCKDKHETLKRQKSEEAK